jgi:hypothetical protein
LGVRGDVRRKECGETQTDKVGVVLDFFPLLTTNKASQRVMEIGIEMGDGDRINIVEIKPTPAD